MTSPPYHGRHRVPDRASLPADQLTAGQPLADRYVLRHRLSPSEPVSYRADDTLLNRSVTVTFLILDSDYAELMHGSEQTEGISALRHRALASLFDVGHDVGVRESFIVTDFVDGVALSELSEQHLPAPVRHQVREYVAALVEDLTGYLRQRGLRHRDLSDANIRVALPWPDVESGEPPLVRVGLVGLYLADGPAAPS